MEMCELNIDRTIKKYSIHALLLVVLVCVVSPSFSQFMPKKKNLNVRLANESRSVIQLKTLLANPKLVSARASCEVTSFYISFLPEGGRLFGPFRTDGPMLKQEHVKYLKEMPDANVKITIEQIHLSCNGKDVSEEPIIVTSFP